MIGLGEGGAEAADYAILAEGERAAAVWAPEHAERVVTGLRARLRAVRRQRSAV